MSTLSIETAPNLENTGPKKGSAKFAAIRQPDMDKAACALPCIWLWHSDAVEAMAIWQSDTAFQRCHQPCYPRHRKPPPGPRGRIGCSPLRKD